MRGGTYCIQGEDVNAALGEAGRVYLVGHLKRPQPQLEHIASLESSIEIGITRYNRVTAEQAHLHKWNTDAVVVLAGMYAVRIISTGESKVLTEGGVCVIEPGISHICVASSDAQVLFVKTPGGDDKVQVEPDKASCDWVETIMVRWGA